MPAGVENRLDLLAFEFDGDEKTGELMQHRVDADEEAALRVDADHQRRVQQIRILPDFMEFTVFFAVFDLEAVFVLRAVFGEFRIGKKRVNEDAHTVAEGIFEGDTKRCVIRIGVLEYPAVGLFECVENKFEQSRFATLTDTVGAVIHGRSQADSLARSAP